MLIELELNRVLFAVSLISALHIGVFETPVTLLKGGLSRPKRHSRPLSTLINYLDDLMARYILHRVATVLSSVRRYHSRAYNCKIDPENPFIKVSQEVREAVENQKPVVALETTIYTHGG